MWRTRRGLDPEALEDECTRSGHIVTMPPRVTTHSTEGRVLERSWIL
jgi:hypothetical protein